MVNKYGAPPKSTRNLQEAIVSSTLMYRSELTWRGQRSMHTRFQKTVNRMSTATLSVLPSTPMAFLSTEGGQMPTVADWTGDKSVLPTGYVHRLLTIFSSTVLV